MSFKKQKIIIAMSGGIDSSVAAALLKKAGFELVGVFMRFWRDPKAKDALNRCCSPEAEKRARSVAAKIGIPFYVLNLEKEFKKKVIDYFLEEYKKGSTPNPCVVCNKEIKFGLLLEKAFALEADYVATGHYARKQELTTNNLQLTTYKLLRAKDKKRDQSYFLWMLSQEQLKHILFPLADLTKQEVRNLAKKFNLPVLDIPESREICFIAKTVNEFLARYLKQKPGRIVDKEGKILGYHQGLWFYTIGQRKSLGILDGPHWVLEKDLKKNLLIVTKNEKDLNKKELIAEKVNWISPKQSLQDAMGQAGSAPELPLKIKAKIRYKHKEASAIVVEKSKGRTYKILFSNPQKAITPGQSIVFYSGKALLGGGIIRN